MRIPRPVRRRSCHRSASAFRPHLPPAFLPPSTHLVPCSACTATCARPPEHRVTAPSRRLAPLALRVVPPTVFLRSFCGLFAVLVDRSWTAWTAGFTRSFSRTCKDAALECDRALLRHVLVACHEARCERRSQQALAERQEGTRRSWTEGSVRWRRRRTVGSVSDPRLERWSCGMEEEL